MEMGFRPPITNFLLGLFFLSVLAGPSAASSPQSCAAHGVSTQEIQAERPPCQNLLREAHEAKEKLEDLREKAKPEQARAAMSIPSERANRDLILRLKQQLSQLETTHSGYVSQAKEALRELSKARNQSGEAQQRLGQFVARQQTELQRKNQERNGFISTGRVLQADGEESRRRFESMPNTQAFQQQRESVRARFQEINRRIEQNNDRLEKVAQEISELEKRIREGHAAVREHASGRQATDSTREGLERIIRENEQFTREVKAMNARLNPEQVGSLAELNEERERGPSSERAQEEPQRSAICASLAGSSDTAALARAGCAVGASQRDTVARRPGESHEELIRRQAIVSRTGGAAELEASVTRLGGADGVRQAYQRQVAELERIQGELRALPNGRSPDIQSPEYDRHRRLLEDYNSRVQTLTSEPALGALASENGIRPIRADSVFQDFQTDRRNSISAAEFGTVTEYQPDYGFKVEGRNYRVPGTEEIRGQFGAEFARAAGATNADAVRNALIEVERVNPRVDDPTAGAFALTPTRSEVEAVELADTVRHRPVAAGQVVGGADLGEQQALATPTAQAIQRVESQDTAEMVTGVLPGVGTIQEYVGADREIAVARDSQAQLRYSSTEATEALERGNERLAGAHLSAAVDVATTTTGMKVIGEVARRSGSALENAGTAVRGFFGHSAESVPRATDRGLEIFRRVDDVVPPPNVANDNLVRATNQVEPVAPRPQEVTRLADEIDQSAYHTRSANDNEPRSFAPKKVAEQRSADFDSYALTRVEEPSPAAAVVSKKEVPTTNTTLSNPSASVEVPRPPERPMVASGDRPVSPYDDSRRLVDPDNRVRQANVDQASLPTREALERRSVVDSVLGDSPQIRSSSQIRSAPAIADRSVPEGAPSITTFTQSPSPFQPLRTGRRQASIREQGVEAPSSQRFVADSSIGNTLPSRAPASVREPPARTGSASSLASLGRVQERPLSVGQAPHSQRLNSDSLPTLIPSQRGVEASTPEKPSWGIGDTFRQWFGRADDSPSVVNRMEPTFDRAPAPISKEIRDERRIQEVARTVEKIEDRYVNRFWQPDPQRPGRLREAQLEPLEFKRVRDQASEVRKQNQQLRNEVNALNLAIERELGTAKSQNLKLSADQARSRVLTRNEDQILEQSRKYTQQAAEAHQGLGFKNVRPVLREAEYEVIDGERLLRNPRRWVLEVRGKGAMVPDAGLTGMLKRTNGSYGIVVDPVEVGLMKAGGFFYGNPGKGKGGNVHLLDLPLFSSRVDKNNVILHEVEHAIRHFKANDPLFRAQALERIADGQGEYRAAVEYMASGRSDVVVSKYAKQFNLSFENTRRQLDDLVVKREAAEYLLRVGDAETGRTGFQTWERHEEVERLAKSFGIDDQAAFLSIDKAARGLEREIGALRVQAGKDFISAVGDDVRLSKNELYSRFLSGDELSTYRSDVFRANRLAQQKDLLEEGREFLGRQQPSRAQQERVVAGLEGQALEAKHSAALLDDMVNAAAPRYRFVDDNLREAEASLRRGQSMQYRYSSVTGDDLTYALNVRDSSGAHLYDVFKYRDGSATVELPSGIGRPGSEKLVLSVDGSNINAFQAGDWAKADGLRRIREALAISQKRTEAAIDATRRFQVISSKPSERSLNELVRRADRQLERELAQRAEARPLEAQQRARAALNPQATPEDLVRAHYSNRVNTNTGRTYSSEAIGFAAELERVAPTELTARATGRSNSRSDPFYGITQRRNVYLGSSAPKAQGWSINVSPVPDAAGRVAKNLLPELRARGVPHSVINDLDFYGAQGVGDRDYGKFIKIFPRSDDEARVISRVIEETLKARGFVSSDFLAPRNSQAIGLGTSARYGRVSTYSNAEERSLLSRVDPSFLENGDLRPGFILDPQGRPIRESTQGPRPNFVHDPFAALPRTKPTSEVIGYVGEEIRTRLARAEVDPSPPTNPVLRSGNRAPASVAIGEGASAIPSSLVQAKQSEAIVQAALDTGLTKNDARKIQSVIEEESRLALTTAALRKIARGEPLSRQESETLTKVLYDAGLKQSIGALGGGFTVGE
jgi:hypothetical protein